ncbi:MAG: hypothetical protein IT258_16635 [Saprospiraceae bacterium]|nr:hypothetical protein [Saprospiraceae bacterium]
MMRNLLFTTILCLVSIAVICQDPPKLTEEQLLEKVNRKLRDFCTDLTTICDKSMGLRERDEVISTAASYYFTSSALIYVSNVNKPDNSIPYHPSTYLTHLRDLPYSEIDYLCSITAPPKLTEINGSSYKGEGRYTQVFKGYDASGTLIYGDVTEKKVKFRITYEKDPYSGKGAWLIKFTAIEVTDTSKLPKRK